MKSELKQRTVQELANLYLERKLPVSPEYQRGTKWRRPQKQALVDSLLRGQGRTLPIIPNALHETESGFPRASQPKPLNNGWFIEVGDSQEVLIQRARRLLN
jgi:hypothetical protein